MNEPYYNILDIIRGTTVDGPGLRTAIYFAGCNHHCPDCHNPQSWHPEAGKLMSLSEIMEIVEEEEFDVTLTGGDPLFRPDSIKILIEELKKRNKNIWLYTGYTWNEILEDNKLRSAVANVDIVVDEPFISKFKDPDLPFRGSSNQNIVDVRKSFFENKLVNYKR